MINKVKECCLLQVYECLDSISVNKSFLYDQADGKGEVVEKYGFMDLATSQLIADILEQEDKSLHRQSHNIELFDTIDDFVSEMEDRGFTIDIRGDAQIELQGFVYDMIVYIQH